MDALRREMDTLKPNVRKTLMSSQAINSMKKRILMIYLLVRLGLVYHFENEIKESLKEGFQKIEEMMAGTDDLYTTSIIFWVFKTYGHHISTCKHSLPRHVMTYFRNLKGNNGMYKKCLSGDAKGLLALHQSEPDGTRNTILHLTCHLSSDTQPWKIISLYNHLCIIHPGKIHHSLKFHHEVKAPDDDIDRQPNYLKFLFKFIVDCFEEFEREMMLEGNSYCVEATKKEVTCQTWSLNFRIHVPIYLYWILLCNIVRRLNKNVNTNIFNVVYQLCVGYLLKQSKLIFFLIIRDVLVPQKVV
ncbi:unnamed protein product [Brassica oleracea var. botrytis]|uniref:BnaC04g54640D protein n=1 Tax=Brassica napus TaxID=3708 RepID=A0A078JCX8_BRANA|nr:BnaC04g54640D [Brassica napus]